MIADRPLFLLGHSFGALVAIEVALRLDADGLTPLAGFRVFDAPPADASMEFVADGTFDAQLLTALARRGWLSAAVGEIGGPAMVKYGLPPLRGLTVPRNLSVLFDSKAYAYHSNWGRVGWKCIAGGARCLEYVVRFEFEVKNCAWGWALSH